MVFRLLMIMLMCDTYYSNCGSFLFSGQTKAGFSRGKIFLTENGRFADEKTDKARIYRSKVCAWEISEGCSYHGVNIHRKNLKLILI